jgi:putative ABC transport system permease protein
MKGLGEIARRLSMLARRRQFDGDLEEEVRLYMELRQQAHLESGMAASAARAAAQRRFGNATAWQERSRMAWGWEWLDHLAHDVRFGLRMLGKNPGFTTVAILTLALGIGANTAIFSVMDTVMLRLLPVERPDELVQMAMMTHGFGRGPRTNFTNSIWEAVRNRQDIFAAVLAWGTSQFNLAPSGVADNVRGLYVSGSYFPALCVRPASGRLIAPADDERGCQGVAVLGYGFWQERYGGAPVIGKSILVNQHRFEIIGVSASGFYGTEVGSAFDVAAPICTEALVEGKNSSLDNRSSWWFRVMARWKPGIGSSQISARLGLLSPQIFAETVPTTWTPGNQQSFLGWTLTALPAGNGISALRRQYDSPLKALLAIAGFVLLLACTNITSLMLARAAARSKEIGVRLALGASRLRLVRQLLTESVLLSCAGGLLGAFFAQWGSRLLVSYISTKSNKVALDLALDGRVLAFTAGASIFTGLLFGVWPAFRATRASVSGAIKGSPAKNAQGDARLRAGRWTAAAQVAVSLVLVATAGLFVRSFKNLVTLDGGFDRNNVLEANVDLHNAVLANARLTAAQEAVLERVRALPGVIAASESLVTPISGRTWDDFIVVDGERAPQGADRDAYLNYVSTGYFAAMRTAILEGRDFDEHDTAAGARVAIVNQALARKFFGGTNVLGRTFRRFETQTKLGKPFLIVGISRDAKYDSLQEGFPPTAYFPFSQAPAQPERFSLEVRTASPPSQLTGAIERAIVGVNRSASMQFTTLAQQVDDSLTQERLLASLSGFFGALALLLATIGFYGVLGYLLLQRQKEIGIRMALGAQRGPIFRLVIGDVAALLLTGVAVGLALTWATTWYLQNLLFDLRARDGATFAISATLLAAAALAASYLPVRRALRVDPMAALRYE